MSCTSASMSRFAVAVLSGIAVFVAGCAGMGRPQAPEATVDAITFTQVGAGGAQLSLRIAVRNPNPFALEVATFDYGLSIEERAVAAGKLARGVRFAANATGFVDVEMQIDFAAFRAAVDGVVRRGQVRYELTGTAVLGDGTRLPFARGGELDSKKIQGLRN